MTRSIACPHEDELEAWLIEDLPRPELESHLAGCESCQRELRQLETVRSAGLEIPSPDSVDAEDATEVSSSGDDDPRVIGKYRVLGRLGFGEEGIAFRVYDLGLDRDLVLKMPRRPDSAMWETERLIDEGRALAQIDHPNIARVVDLGFHKRQPYLVMEYVRGRNLRQYVGDHALPPREVGALVAQVARALAPAHALGITHQDIKPRNVLIDEAGRPRIIDFGLARLRDAWQMEAEESEVVGGSDRYMAPEQACEKTESIGPRTDVFGLGAVLYELLVGRAPFEGANAQESLQRARECRFDQEPLKSRRIPRGLASACIRAMAANPNGRYANVEDFAQDLELAVRPSRIPRVLLAVGAIVALVAGLMWGIGRNPPLVPAPAQPLVHLHPEGVTIPSGLPVRAGTRFYIECDMPSSLTAGIFFYDTEGNVGETKIYDEFPTADGTQVHIVSDTQEFDEKGGVEVIVICADAREKPSEQEVRALLHEVLGQSGIQGLSPFTMLLMTGDRVEAATNPNLPRGYGPVPRRDKLRELKDSFQELRLKLRDRYDFVAGVAFPHEADVPADTK